jgi:hypothetical protein
MNPVIRNILAIIIGAIAGSAVNMGIVAVSGSVIPPPEGVNPSDINSLKSNIHLFEAKHFIFPFLAHALGTLVGAWLCALIAASSKMLFAMIIGILFLVGGIAAAFMIPAPGWFIALDLVAAYLPMAWIGGKLGKR